jgi:excinuclease UvrABC nuclease subunit
MSISIYYVYAHIKNNEIVYIGKGINERAWSTNRVNEEHASWAQESILNGTWGSSIQILEAGLDDKKAYELERNLIKIHKPKYNSEMCKIKKCPQCNFETKSTGGFSSHMRTKHSGT